MTRNEIESNTISLIRTAGGTRPDLRIVEIDGRRVAVKDFQRSDPLFRLLIGPLLIGREGKALSRLTDVPGAPKLVQLVDRYGLALEHIDGKNLKEVTDPIPDGFFDKLIEVVNTIHGRGIAHCDLRTSGNVMITNDGKPCIVDFAACVMRGRGWNPFINWLFHRFKEADLYAVLLLKKKHAPDSLRPEELQRLQTPLPYERFAKSFGISIRNITRRLLTRGKRN